jgi:hypothetical protein
MDREGKRTLDDFRLTRAGELENELSDELAAGTIDRQGFLRRGALLSLSMPTLAAILGAFGLDPATVKAAVQVSPDLAG